MKYRANASDTWHEIKIKALDGMPISAIIDMAGDNIPNGWLLCDGSEISRTEYVDLFNVIGTTYGDGDGSTTFNLPNSNGKVRVSIDGNDTDFDTLGLTSGSKTNTHYHWLPIIGDTNNGNFNFIQWNKNFGYPTQAITSPNKNALNNTPSAEAMNGYQYGSSEVETSTIQPSIVVNTIIKVKNTTPTMASIVNTKNNSTTDGYSCGYINDLHEWKTLGTNVTGGISVDLSNIDFTELWCVVRHTTDTEVAVSQLIVKNDLTTTTKKYRNGFYYTSTFNCGVSFVATTNSVLFNDFYYNGQPANATMNVYYR